MCDALFYLRFVSVLFRLRDQNKSWNFHRNYRRSFVSSRARFVKHLLQHFRARVVRRGEEIYREKSSPPPKRFVETFREIKICCKKAFHAISTTHLPVSSRRRHPACCCNQRRQHPHQPALLSVHRHRLFHHFRRPSHFPRRLQVPEKRSAISVFLRAAAGWRCCQVHGDQEVKQIDQDFPDQVDPLTKGCQPRHADADSLQNNKLVSDYNLTMPHPTQLGGDLTANH